MAQIRDKQASAIDFIQRAYDAGYRHVVIAAPTGSGKSAIGVAVCQWADQNCPLDGERGGYYIVTQKLLQDQLTKDFAAGKFSGTGATIKSAVEYICPKFKNCGMGSRSKGKCPCKKDDTCSYSIQKGVFMGSMTSITNYSYIFAEHKYANNLPKRKVIILDECHNLERQLLKFNDLKIGPDLIRKWHLMIESIPTLRNMDEFVQWVDEVYEPEVKDKTAHCLAMANEFTDDEFNKMAVDLDQHLCKMHRAIKLIKDNPENWVFWSEENKERETEYIARPLDAAPFRPELVDEMGALRIYMSAFPGTKDVFCRSLGLNPKEVAWKGLSSSFPPQNRPVIIGPVGSMSKRNIEVTLPSFLKVTASVLKIHAEEKGIIHCNSYKLGQSIMDHFRGTDASFRLIFPKNADERVKAYQRHFETKEPTVLVSPSMTEGFDFAGDLATWQIIAKCPYPSLGDHQVCAKKEQDPEWYALETIKTIIQACGRVCRSETDKGKTYVLDADVANLLREYEHMFPKWFMEAVVYPKRRQ